MEQRVLAIGDIHGCYDVLRALIDYVQPSDQDILVTLGDYVDRGPSSMAVIDWLIQAHSNMNIVSLRGNHEIMFCDARLSPEYLESFCRYGGQSTLDSYSPFEGTPGRIEDVPEEHWQFIEQRLQPYYETESHIFVHANLYPDLPLEDQPDYMIYWEKFTDPPPHFSGKTMICGHTSQKSGLPLKKDRAICIDTWAYGEGWLSCLDARSQFVWQANRAGETRKFFLDDGSP